MKIIVKRAGTPAVPAAVPHSSPYQGRYGAWGYVEEAHSGDHSADVVLDTGAYLKNCPVASREWVVPGDEYSSGERNLPPAGARVFVMMPHGNFDGSFILCSGFIATSKPEQETFMEEGKEEIRKLVKPGKWTEIHDCVTGTHEVVSPDGETGIKIDYGTEDEPKEDAPELHLSIFGEISADIVADDSAALSVFDEVSIEHKKGDSCTVKVFDTEIVIKPGEVSLKPKKTAIEVDGDAEITTTGNTTVKGQNINVEASAKAVVKAPQVQITGGQFMLDGTVAPGSGPLCALPACLFTGAPHGGNMASGT